MRWLVMLVLFLDEMFLLKSVIYMIVLELLLEFLKIIGCLVLSGSFLMVCCMVFEMLVVVRFRLCFVLNLMLIVFVLKVFVEEIV